MMSDEKMEPKPLEYWRDRLDCEIVAAVSRGQKPGTYGMKSISLSDLAEERLLEILVCGGGEKHAALQEARLIRKKEDEQRAKLAKEIDKRMKEKSCDK